MDCVDESIILYELVFIPAQENKKVFPLQERLHVIHHVNLMDNNKAQIVNDQVCFIAVGVEHN